MGINITHTLGGYSFDNRENLKNAAKNILTKQGASNETAQKILESSIFESDRIYSNAQLSILKASSQISMNGNLKETLRYLKSNKSAKSEKEPILGELWNIFSKEKENSFNENEFFIEIDYSADNIFAAA